MTIDNNDNKINKSRIFLIDLVRGFAILLVIFGHVIETNTISYETSMIFNIIWSLQMPLFMIISGFLNYRIIKNYKELTIYFKKKFISLLFPWLIWTFVIKSILDKGFGIKEYIDYFRWILFNMDSGYWFLFSLWTICSLFGVSSFIASKFSKNVKIQFIYTVIIILFLSLFLLVLGLLFGLNFLCIKLTLYYIPFFLIGYIIKYVFKNKQKSSFFNKILEKIFFPSLVLYILLIINFNLYLNNDTLLDIFIRMIISLIGSFLIFMILNCISNKQYLLLKGLSYAGYYSLELYLVHYFFIRIIKVHELPILLSIDGLIICLVNIIITLILSTLIIYIISINRWSNFILFGKKNKND